METKRCSKCGLDKDRTTGFYHNKCECKSCTKARVRSYAPKPRNRRLEYLNRKIGQHDNRTEQSFMQKFKRHGLTLDQYHAMAERQDFLCSICGEEPQPQNARQGNVDNFVIDHDHEHPKHRVRSLTCWQCNSGLGSFRDNPDIARRAMNYLQTHHAFR